MEPEFGTRSPISMRFSPENCFYRVLSCFIVLYRVRGRDGSCLVGAIIGVGEVAHERHENSRKWTGFKADGTTKYPWPTRVFRGSNCASRNFTVLFDPI